MTEAGTLLDLRRLEQVDAEAFQRTSPYPWLALEGAATDDAYERLRRGMPPLELMQPSFGRKRAHGQAPHDRYALEYSPELPVDPIWHQLVRELQAPAYRDWLARLFGTPRLRLSYHWHYTPRGCSVSPHCDARRKLGSHIFYFNTHGDWDPAWGGQTLILDDEGRFKRNSAPRFEDFPRRMTAPSLGNRSLLFRRQGNSWHGVEPITCPEGHMRKVFIVVVNADGVWRRALRAVQRRLRRDQVPRSGDRSHTAGATTPRAAVSR